MTKFLQLFLIFISAGLLSAGWVLLGNWPAGLVLVLLLTMGIILNKRNFPAAMNFALVLFCGAAALGLWRGMNFPLAFAGALCAFAAWDLHSFSQRLAFAAEEDGPQSIERQHVLRLGLVLILGLAINLVSFSIHFSFSFEWAIGLAVFTFVGIGALVSWLRNRED